MKLTDLYAGEFSYLHLSKIKIPHENINYIDLGATSIMIFFTKWICAHNFVFEIGNRPPSSKKIWSGGLVCENVMIGMMNVITCQTWTDVGLKTSVIVLLFDLPLSTLL